MIQNNRAQETRGKLWVVVLGPQVPLYFAALNLGSFGVLSLERKERASPHFISEHTESWNTESKAKLSCLASSFSKASVSKLSSFLD